MSEVTIFDELILPAGEADRWLDRWRSDYLPGAVDRGLDLRGAWRGSTEEPAETAIVIQWRVPSVEAFFASRGRAGADEQVQAFWAATDEVAIRRDRRVLGDAGLEP